MPCVRFFSRLLGIHRHVQGEADKTACGRGAKDRGSWSVNPLEPRGTGRAGFVSETGVEEAFFHPLVDLLFRHIWVGVFRP